MKVNNQMSFQLMSLPENVAVARVTVAALAAQLNFTLSELDEIKVAVSEAVSNAIIHGYDNNPKYSVQVVIKLYEHALEIVVEDKGKGIEDIEQALQPAFSSDPERMGLGFVFMQSFMNDFRVKSEVGKGTQVIMVKKLEAESDPSPES
ncbi:MAG: anti-sigma F factor [Carboxydocellales bacterium]